MAITIQSNMNAMATSAMQRAQEVLRKSMQSTSGHARGAAGAVDTSATTSGQGQSPSKVDFIDSSIASGQQFLKAQGNALETAGHLLDRMAGLADLGQNTQISDQRRAEAQTEFATLQKQFAELGTKSVNGQNLFSSSDKAEAQTLTTGARPSEQTAVTAGALTTDKDVAQALRGDTTLASTDSAKAAAEAVRQAQAAVGKLQGQNMKETSNLDKAELNWHVYKSAWGLGPHSQITDANRAMDEATNTSYTILQQSGTAMLAQANASPMSALRLLG